MLLIVGLGNPGNEYKGTRHNIGFDVIETLAKRHAIPVSKRDHKAVFGTGQISNTRVILARPMTYMNLSGEAISLICNMYKITPDEVIVIVDDIALPVGKIRMRLKGSAGGHNGLSSIEKYLHTQEYKRIRVGVGSALPGRLVDHVLGKFKPDELETVSNSIELTCDALENAISIGFENAMNKYNLKADVSTNRKSE